MKEFKRELYRVKVDETIYELKKPSVKVFKEYSDKFAGDSEDKITPVVEFLSQLGLPKDIGWEMEPDWLFQMVDDLTGKKK